MPLEPNLSSKFRAALKREIPVLIDQGILTEESKNKIAALYQFDELGKESSRLLTAVLFTIGSLLIGGGVISFLLALTILPLAWLIRSRVLYFLTFLGFILAIPALTFAQMEDVEYILPALAAAAFLAWAAGEFHRLSGLRKEFGNSLVNLGIAAFICGAFFWSFDIWSAHYRRSVNRFYWLIPAGCAVLAGVAAIVRVWERMDTSHKRYVIGVILVFILNCFAAVVGARAPVLSVIVTNLAGLLIAAVCIDKGIIEERRLIFWVGSLFVAILVVSRFFEYESSLLLKSLAFIFCGAITMIAGIAYERFLHRKAVTAQ